jgi:hypothetical protein
MSLFPLRLPMLKTCPIVPPIAFLLGAALASRLVLQALRICWVQNGFQRAHQVIHILRRR